MQPLFVRLYTTEDEAMIQSWRDAHAGEETERAALPPLGVVVELDGAPAGALWCIEPAGYPCAYLELPVTRPGLTVMQATAVFRFAVESLMALAGKGWNPPGVYTAFRCTPPPGIARVLARMGFVRESVGELIPMIFTETV